MGKSEIALLRQQIELELQAMQRGLYGIAQGTARHEFIHARMERVGACHDTLAHALGETSATELVCQLYMQVLEPKPLS